MPGESSDIQIDSVHKFGLDRNLRETSSSALLEAGKQTVNDAVAELGWSTVTLTLDLSTLRVGENVFSLAISPPSLNRQSTKSNNVEEWDTTVFTDAEALTPVEDLEEFHSTDLESLFNPAVRRPVVEVTVPARSRRSDESHLLFGGDGEPSQKRRKLDTSHLHEIIPQPHFHSSHNVARRPVDPKLVPPYRKRKPVPIPPFTFQDAAERLKVPHGRTAWIVPVRGILPWDQCTAACVVDAELGLIDPSLVVEGTELLSWTHASIRAFWDFLLALQKAGMLGPLAVSFHATSSEASSSVFWPSHERQIKTPISDSESLSDASVHRPTLLSSDYIKVYHDAPYAMYLRSVLDAWQFEFSDNTGKRKLRVLKGAKFVLVDERAKGILIC